MRTGTFPAITASVVTSSPTTKHTRYVDITIVSSKRTARIARGEDRLARHRGVGDGGQALLDDERDPEDRLGVGLVPAGEGLARVGGLELRRRDGLLRAVRGV